jgi:uncharacterized membrane protein HdeD (DUF308 family)
MLDVMARNWWIWLIRGIAAIIFGILAFLNPQDALLAIVLVWGAYALIDGLFALISGFRGRETNRQWWVTVLEGVVGVIAGILTFIYPDITALVLLYIIAAWAIITGILEIIAAIQLRKEIEGEFWLGLSGLASIVFGVLLFLFPGAGILTVLWMVAAYAIVFGVLMILLAFRLKGYADRPAQPTQPRTA